MKTKLNRTRKKHLTRLGLAVALATALGAGCNSNSNTSTSTSTSNSTSTSTSTPTPGSCTNCSVITPENFVSALVSLAQSGQIAPGYSGSKLVKAQSLETGWFVIWDGATQTYVAVSANTSAMTGQCTDNYTTCSNINPQSAALAFTESGNKPVYEAGSVSASSGSVQTTSNNGTISYGTYSGSSTTEHQVGTYVDGGYGQVTYPGAYTENVTTGVENVTSYITTQGIGGGVIGYTVAPTGQTDSSGAPIYQDTYGAGMLFSVGTQTKDVDLQRAQMQNTSLLQRAAQISVGLQMDFKSAIQLTQLADKIQSLQSSQNQLTSADRAAITQNLLSIAGVSQDEVNQAVQGGLSGDMTQASALMDKVSQNLGMPSATFRDQILPKLGVNLN